MEKRKKFNRQEVRNRLEKESKFIANLLSVSQIPSHDYEEAQDDVFLGQEKPSKEEAKEIRRARSFQELSNRLSKLKGTTDFSLKNKMMKKSLTKRLKKKTGKEERRQKKKNLRIEKWTSGGVVKHENVEKVAKLVTKPTKPVFNSQGKMVFSKFDFSESGVPEGKKKGEKDPRKILETLQKQKETVKELREAGQLEKASSLMEKITWKNALAKVEGQKIKDDPTLLKKTVKKIEQKKKSSTKKWDARIVGVQKSKDDRQKKRSDNISKRNQDKKKKVLKKAVKKGRMIP